MRLDESLNITRSGSGTVYYSATDSLISSGKIYFHGGVNYVHGGSLGGSADNLLTAEVDANKAPVRFYFCGGTHNRNFLFLRSTVNGVINEYDFRFLSGTVNTINGYIRSQNGANLKYVYEGDSHTVLRGGYETTWINSFWLESHLYRGAVLEILDKPLVTKNSSSARGCFYAHSTGGSGDRAKVVFGASGNFSTNGVYFGGPMKIEMGTDFAFNTNSVGVATALGFMQVPSTENSDYVAPVEMDLCGHSQRFGDLCTVPVWVADNKVSGWNGYWGPSSSSYITSESPATLYALQNGDPNKDAYPWYTTFRGAVSLVKEGTNTLALAGVSTTTGRLEVAKGRIEFAGDGSWLEADEVVVSGGTLAIDRRGRIGIVDLVVSGGTVELAAGVHQRVRSLKVCQDGVWSDVKPGRYFADRLPDVVSGSGSLIVNNAGTRIVVR
jgi:autotransporter-associated beta strand protein